MSLSSAGSWSFISISSLGALNSCFCGLYLPCMARFLRAADRKKSVAPTTATRSTAPTATGATTAPKSSPSADWFFV